jgi:hypothetical protein
MAQIFFSNTKKINVQVLLSWFLTSSTKYNYKKISKLTHNKIKLRSYTLKKHVKYQVNF